MHRLITTCVGLLCATSVLVPAICSGDDSAEVTNLQATDCSKQTRDGVTVKVEKLAVERVLNGAGWLRKEFGPDWRTRVPADFDPASFWVFRVFISVCGHTEGWTASSLELGKGQTRIGGAAVFDPSPWQGRLPDVAVDPEAKGLMLWAVVEGGVRIERLSPAKAKLEVTTADGKKMEFVFTDLTP